MIRHHRLNTFFISNCYIFCEELVPKSVSVRKCRLKVTMFSTQSLFYLTILVAMVAATTDKKCYIENKIEESDWDELHKNTSNPAEKMLCFFKCRYTESGVFNADKTVDAEKLIAHVEKWRKLKDETKSEIRECLAKQTTTVNSCQDVKPYYTCVTDSVGKELKATA